jgi:hypothetical protein
VGEPQPVDPDPEEKPKPPDAARPAVQRADWLVGADDGIAAEIERHESGNAIPREAPRLRRPGADSQANLPRPSGLFGPGVLPLRPDTPELRDAPEAKTTLPAWDRGASSVPTIKRSAAGARPGPSSAPELARDFPMDDAEERARVAAALAEQQRQEAEIEARPHEVVAPKEFELPVVAVPWWAELQRFVLSDQRAQLGIVAVLLALAALTFWPRGGKTISVAHLKQHPERYADTSVRVGGRVSEVFSVGGSWAYTLVQGRDTIVVFSRTREPKVRDDLVIVGTLSSGYLDGQSRVAIFESTATR